MSSDAAEESAAATRDRLWLAPVLFMVAVGSVIAVASSVASRHRSLHGADFFTGLYVDARFAPPPSLVGATSRRHTTSWPLAPGSGSLRVRFEGAARGAASAVTAVRVEPAADLIDGVEARVHVTGYDTSIVVEGALRPRGRVALECVERAADGEHTHRIELYGDGVTVDPDAPR